MSDSVKLIGVVAPFFLMFCMFYIGGLFWNLFFATMFFAGILMGHSALPEWMSGWLFYGWIALNCIGLLGCSIDVWPRKKS